jgi:hypothetical protein
MLAKKVLKRTVLAAIVLFATAELGARLSGAVDFPLYAVDEELGYFVKPGQSGRFLNRNAWFFNEKSMPTQDSWTQAKRNNIMLIGNSIVMGGNAYDQSDKLEPLISKDLGPGYTVWPLATGGWTNVNESAYLRRNPDVVQATNFFVWEFMYGGLHELSRWRGEYIFPSKKPLIASWYVFRRYVIPKFIQVDTNELPPTGEMESRNLKEFESKVARLSTVSGLPQPGIIFLYPDKLQLRAARQAREWLPERPALEDICKRYNLKLVDVAANPEWTESMYRGGTHPTVEGNRVLAHILASAIATTFAPAGAKTADQAKTPDQPEK